MAGLGADRTDQMSFDVVEHEDGTVLVSVSGELDISNVERLAAVVAPALARDPARLVLDVSGLRFADSSAIALWVQWATAVPEIEVHHAPALLRKVIDTMGLTETLRVAP
jgi:anti-anti-sigma factor